jgi:hypothetical protein
VSQFVTNRFIHNNFSLHFLFLGNLINCTPQKNYVSNAQKTSTLNSMEQRHFWKPDIRQSGEYISPLLQERKLNYRVPNNPQDESVYGFAPCSSKIHYLNLVPVSSRYSRLNMCLLPGVSDIHPYYRRSVSVLRAQLTNSIPLKLAYFCRCNRAAMRFLLWGVAEKLHNKQSLIADKGWYSDMGSEDGLPM